MVSDILAEFTADDLVEDLVHQEDQNRPHQDEPAQTEEDEGEEIQQSVTVVLSSWLWPLNVVDGVIVPQRGSEVVQALLAQDWVERLRPDHVSEDPPGDGDHPEDDEDHHHDVVHEVTAKLTETPGNLGKRCNCR